ncbi:MAG: nucleotidyltransferase domain-containing protein [Bacteriovorax sp.]|nr:nucleotidyltransferase domain-containing protein [Bacteriovorax sp.]
MSGVLLVGSYAQNKANLNSDIDIMLFVSNIEFWISNQDWLDKLKCLCKCTEEIWSIEL